VLSPFDIRFFRELKNFAAAEDADFRSKISSAKSFEEVQYYLGYHQAINDLLEEGEEIERKLTSSQE